MRKLRRSFDGLLMSFSPFRHVSPTERNGTRYRGIPSAFNIGSGSDTDNNSDEEGSSDEDGVRAKEKNQRKERVKISAYVNQSGVLGYFPCHLVTPKKMDMIPMSVIIRLLTIRIASSRRFLLFLDIWSSVERRS